MPQQAKSDSPIQRTSFRVPSRRAWAISALVSFVVLCTGLTLFLKTSAGDDLPMKLLVHFQGSPAPTGEPILVTGESGAGDFVFVRALNTETVQFGYDAWGLGGPLSKPVAYRQGHTLRVAIDAPALRGTSGSKGQLLIVVDGHEVIREQVAYHPSKGSIHIGTNPIGGTSCGTAFAGTLTPADTAWSRILWKSGNNPGILFLVLLAALLVPACVFATMYLSGRTYSKVPARTSGQTDPSPKGTAPFAVRIMRCILARPYATWAISALLCLILFSAVYLSIRPGEEPTDFPLKATLTFPPRPNEINEPLVVTGKIGAADYLFVKYGEQGNISFGYDAWGFGGPTSGAIPYHPGHAYSLQVDMPSLYENESAHQQLVIRFDGREVLRENVQSHPSAGELYLGRNPLGGTSCGDRFSGEITRLKNQIGDYEDLGSPMAAVLVLVALAVLIPFLIYTFILPTALMAEAESPTCFDRAFVKEAGQKLLPLLVCGLAVAPLFDLQMRWGSDWQNHQWVAAHYAATFAHRHHFPATLNTPQVIGLANGVFYADILYGAVALIGIAIGIDAATRVVIVLALLIQFLCVRRLIRRLSESTFWANTVATLVTWEVFPLTNIYNRGSIPEFVAVCFLNCAACYLTESAIVGMGPNRWRMSLRLALLVGLATLCHPITAAFGGLCLVTLALGCLLFSSRRLDLLRALGITAVLNSLLLAPWAYLLLKYQRHLLISQDLPGAHHASAALYYLAYDSIWTRLAPFPWAIGLNLYPVPQSFTAYVDTQTNVPLLIALCGIGVATVISLRRERGRNVSRGRWLASEGPVLTWVGIFASCLFAFALWLSIDTHLPHGAVWVERELPALPRFIGAFQFAYRLVSYQNLGLLLATAIISRATLRRNHALLLPALCWFSLGLAANSAALKLTEGAAMSESLPLWRTERDALMLSKSYYAERDYTLALTNRDDVSTIQLPRQRLNLQVQAGQRFGEVLPQEFTLEQPTLVTLNVAIFPWNKLYLDGRLVRLTEIVPDRYLSAIAINAGHHRIEFRSAPDPLWSSMRMVSWVIFLFLVTVLMVDWLRCEVQTRSGRADLNRGAMVTTA